MSFAATNGPRQRVELMGLAIDRVSESETVARAMHGIREGRGGWICPANLDVLRQTVAAPDIRALVEQADLVVADGTPLVWASRVQGDPLPERVAGSSLVHTLSAAAVRNRASVFLLGGDPGVAERAAERLSADNPGLRICGTHSPAHGFETDARRSDAIVRVLRVTRPEVVFVALGFPKQERLIQRLRSELPDVWFVSVGISLSLVCGEVARAPHWMRRTGLEWLHRLAQEPRRLARRYLVDGVPFLARLLAAAARRRGAPKVATP